MDGRTPTPPVADFQSKDTAVVARAIELLRMSGEVPDDHLPVLEALLGDPRVHDVVRGGLDP
jgi:hypothetical protein